MTQIQANERLLAFVKDDSKHIGHTCDILRNIGVDQYNFKIDGKTNTIVKVTADFISIEKNHNWVKFPLYVVDWIDCDRSYLSSNLSIKCRTFTMYNCIVG